MTASTLLSIPSCKCFPLTYFLATLEYSSLFLLFREADALSSAVWGRRLELKGSSQCFLLIPFRERLCRFRSTRFLTQLRFLLRHNRAREFTCDLIELQATCSDVNDYQAVATLNATSDPASIYAERNFSASCQNASAPVGPLRFRNSQVA
jgi:hypothetical protein